MKKERKETRGERWLAISSGQQFIRKETTRGAFLNAQVSLVVDSQGLLPLCLMRNAVGNWGG